MRSPATLSCSAGVESPVRRKYACGNGVNPVVPRVEAPRPQLRSRRIITFKTAPFFEVGDEAIGARWSHKKSSCPPNCATRDVRVRRGLLIEIYQSMLLVHSATQSHQRFISLHRGWFATHYRSSVVPEMYSSVLRKRYHMKKSCKRTIAQTHQSV